ncbi:MAG: undecaprenyldiphospho-muramoylpentapeptide beta-N-acetylglucosaminyltransferase [Alphaproteobacteria bacterium]|nr:undecaprenyldiphospho-muramoylpentapeptide beta-N-acetylglucosaminyltransferase [Alphaproteobacteria bacterium]
MKEGRKSPMILISSGGTGGHMTPAAALAADLKQRGFTVELVTDPRGRKFAQSMFAGIPVHEVRAGTAGSGFAGKVRGLSNLGIGIAQALKLVAANKPDLVVGFGGYPSVPGVWAAQQCNVPTIIHEQNAVLGKANLFLAPKAERIALSLPGGKGLENEEKMRCVITGNPVRPEIAALAEMPYPELTPGGKLNILVMGGSLGANIFADVVPPALTKIPALDRKRLHVTQQCRAEDMERVEKAYKDAGISAKCATFFDNVAEILKTSHLVIARSGASTVAELTAAGRPAIYVPYPHHKDQQQKKNAEMIEDIGGAWVMVEGGFTVEALLAKLETVLQNPQILKDAAEHAKSAGRPDAAHKLGNLVTAIAGGW